MKKVIDFIFLFLGMVYLVSALILLFGKADPHNYEIFFGIELNRASYITYKMIIGVILIVVSSVDLLRKYKRSSK